MGIPAVLPFSFTIYLPMVTQKSWKHALVDKSAKTFRPGESDLLFFNLATGSLVKRVELADVIADKEKSKCRFVMFIFLAVQLCSVLLFKVVYKFGMH